jgi:hypothetical protein
MSDDDTVDPVDAEIVARVVAEIAGEKLPPLTDEQIAEREQRIAERRAQDELERLVYQWEAEERQREQDEADAKLRVRDRLAQQREQAGQRAREATSQAQLPAAEQAAHHALGVRQRIAQHDREQHTAVYWGQWQAVADGIGKLAALHSPQPVPLGDRIAELEAQLDPEPEPSAWHRFNWR